jgi:hypothetical protein
VQGPPSLQHFHPSEHTELCKYLGLPLDPTELFSEIANRGLARLWAQHPSVQASVQASSMRTLSFPLKLNSLVRLPEDYSELVNNVSTFSCPNVGVSDGCRVPAMCLICGKVICSQSYCCQGNMKIFSRCNHLLFAFLIVILQEFCCHLIISTSALWFSKGMGVALSGGRHAHSPPKICFGIFLQ